MKEMMQQVLQSIASGKKKKKPKGMMVISAKPEMECEKGEKEESDADEAMEGMTALARLKKKAKKNG